MNDSSIVTGSSRRSRLALVLVVLAALAGAGWRCYSLDRPFLGRHGSVSAHTAVRARNFARHGWTATHGVAWDNGIPGKTFRVDYYYSWSPLYTWLLGGVLLVLPATEAVLRGVSLLFSLAALPLVYLVGRTFGRRAGALGLVLFALLPLHVYYSRLVCQDVAALTLVLATMVLALADLREETAPQRAAGAVGCFALAGAVGWMGLTLAPWLVGCWLPRWRSRWPAMLAVVLLVPLIAGATLLHPVLAGIPHARELLWLKLSGNQVGLLQGPADHLPAIVAEYLRLTPSLALLAAGVGLGWYLVRWRSLTPCQRSAGLLLVGYALTWPLLTTGFTRNHHFQLLSTLPALAVLGGLAVDRGYALLERRMPRGKQLALVFSLAFFGVVLAQAYPQWHRLFYCPDWSVTLRRGGAFIQRTTAPADWVINWGPPGFVTWEADRLLIRYDWEKHPVDTIPNILRINLRKIRESGRPHTLWCCFYPHLNDTPAAEFFRRRYPVVEHKGYLLFRIDQPPAGDVAG